MAKTENTLLMLGVGGVVVYFMVKEGRLPSPAGMVQSMLPQFSLPSMPQFSLPQFPDYIVPALDPATGCGAGGRGDGDSEPSRSWIQNFIDNFFGTPGSPGWTGEGDPLEPKDIIIHAPTATIELPAFETPLGRTEIYPILPPFVSIAEALKSWFLGPIYTIIKHGGIFPIGTIRTPSTEPSLECPGGVCPTEREALPAPFFIPQTAGAAPASVGGTPTEYAPAAVSPLPIPEGGAGGQRPKDVYVI